jgi:Fe2+ or Zn2+ uptake regulation protein
MQAKASLDPQLLSSFRGRSDLDNLSEDHIEARRRETELARAVMRYLAEHPQAMDSAQGIAEWWVMRQQGRVEAESVAKVLQQLVDEGQVEKVDSVNGPLYRLRR